PHTEVGRSLRNKEQQREAVSVSRTEKVQRHTEERDDDVQALPHSLRHNRDELQGDLLEHAAAVEYSQEHCGRDDYARHGERVRCVAVEYPGLSLLDRKRVV